MVEYIYSYRFFFFCPNSFLLLSTHLRNSRHTPHTTHNTPHTCVYAAESPPIEIALGVERELIVAKTVVATATKAESLLRPQTPPAGVVRFCSLLQLRFRLPTCCQNGQCITVHTPIAAVGPESWQQARLWQLN